jgi:hypothetical protein
MFQNIELIVEPRKTQTWEEFVENTPAGSIALDGFVNAPPQVDLKTVHINLDHHKGVVRSATNCSAVQVHKAVKDGLVDYIKRETEGIPKVYVNDPDQDVCLSVFILENSNMFTGNQSNPIFNRLLFLTNELDMSGGICRRNLRNELVEQHHWVFEPYNQARESDSLDEAKASDMYTIIEAVADRTMKLMLGTGGKTKIRTEHKIFYQGDDFWMAHEIDGNGARYQLYSLGMQAFINLVGTLENGNSRYSLGRASPFIDFPVKKLCDEFNQEEGLEGIDVWGGSDLIGGSPRDNGTSLDMEELKEITQAYLQNRK